MFGSHLNLTYFNYDFLNRIVPSKMIHFFPLWEIYSLRSNFWRELVINMPHSCLEQTYSQVYMDGTCLWLSISENQTWEECLVSFDLSNEVFFTILMPSNRDNIKEFIKSTDDDNIYSRC
ncbi:hypothetical protein AAZV13_05G093000 [Glycine max]